MKIKNVVNEVLYVVSSLDIYHSSVCLYVFTLAGVTIPAFLVQPMNILACQILRGIMDDAQQNASQR